LKDKPMSKVKYKHVSYSEKSVWVRLELHDGGSVDIKQDIKDSEPDSFQAEMRAQGLALRCILQQCANESDSTKTPI
jgi:hypothetical protein